MKPQPKKRRRREDRFPPQSPVPGMTYGEWWAQNNPPLSYGPNGEPPDPVTGAPHPDSQVAHARRYFGLDPYSQEHDEERMELYNQRRFGRVSGKKRQEDTGWLRIYVIVSEIGSEVFCKIGVTENIQNRLQGLQIGNPVPLKIGYESDGIARKLALKIEAKIHRLIDEHNTSGEWFKCSLERAIATIKEAQASLEQPQ